MSLNDTNCTLIIDRSGSMSSREANGKTRWKLIQESTEALARKMEEFDEDGIDVYTFGSSFKRYEGVTSATVENIFKENEPGGSTDLAGVLHDAFVQFKKRRGQGSKKELIIVVTDGEPDDKAAVGKEIVAVTKVMERDEELGISFLQIGNDYSATQFLKALDDDLTSLGAKFDIVDTITFAEMGNKTMTEVMLNAFND